MACMRYACFVILFSFEYFSLFSEVGNAVGGCFTLEHHSCVPALIQTAKSQN